MKDKFKIIHIAVILVSIIYLGIGVFNNNIWFDETYSVALTNHSIPELCNIAIHDVHPILYYVLLKIFTIVFGHSMIVYRIFSLLPMVILLILSYTHVSKEFGKKTGIYFAFLVGFMPIISHYSTQIRMYTWAILFISLTAFYAYKALKSKNKKDWIIFSLFSVLSAYTHYYALFTIVMINIAMLIYILKYSRESIKKWWIFGFAQGLLYLPGIVIFFMQSFKVAMGFWITIKYPDILLQILESNFKDSITNVVPLILSLIIYVYMIVKTKGIYKEDKKQAYIILIPIAICIAVIVFALAVSKIRPVFITRYMLPMIGLFIFSMSYILSKESKKIVKGIIVVGIIGLSIGNIYSLIQTSYSSKNDYVHEEISKNIQEKDIFVFTDMGVGSIVSTYFPQNKAYFYNIENWDVEEAYKAFAPQMDCVRSIDNVENYDGRIWVIDSQDSSMIEKINKDNARKILNKEEMYNPYSNTLFKMTILSNK